MQIFYLHIFQKILANIPSMICAFKRYFGNAVQGFLKGGGDVVAKRRNGENSSAVGNYCTVFRFGAGVKYDRIFYCI